LGSRSTELNNYLEMDKKISVLPISFEQFSKDPIKGFLFITLIAIGYLYVDQKMQYTEQIESQGNKIEKLEAKIDALSIQLKRSDSLLSATTSKILVLQELGKIK
jgi:hypothetical protein